MAKLKEIQNKQKVVETELVPFNSVGWTMASGASVTFTMIQRDSTNGRPFSNLYPSFNLPSTSGQCTVYNETFADTGLTALTQDKAIVVSIADNKYGELIDGRTIKFTLPMVATNGSSYGVYTLYSSYYTGKPYSSDNSPQASYFGNPRVIGNTTPDPSIASTNVAFLFSDDIKQPVDSNITNWSQGWTEATPRGYKGANTDTFKFTTNSTNTPKAYALSDDTPVGIAYLDKGFMVITDPTIISNFRVSAGTEDGISPLTTGVTDTTGFTNMYYTASTSATCQYYTFEKEWVLTINIIADSGEFYVTENQTAADNVSPYYGAGGSDTGMKFKTPFGEVNKIWDISKVGSAFITEVGLYDAQNRLLAIAKPDRPIEKPKNTQVTLTLKMKF